MRSRVRQPQNLEPPSYSKAREAKLIGLESVVEDLGLSVRTRNALRAIGCDTVEDVLELDLSASVRGLGRKTKDELLAALEHAGFPHPALQDKPASEILDMERSLERMQARIETALGAVAKEVRILKQRLHKVGPRRDN
jgi:DNA-directed RNA polymerase alpha subunit